MKKYLQNFFLEFEYEVDDARILLDAYDAINGNLDAKEAFWGAVDLYNENERCDFGEVILAADHAADAVGVHRYTSELLIFICLSRRLREIYCERGIDEKIYHASMLDLKYKLDECKATKGIVGSFVATWFPGFFNLNRVALGRLQFELCRFGAVYEGEGHCLNPDSTVINIHIPRTGTPLSPESCDEAFAMAKEYFADSFDGECAFMCRSWILSPINLKILSEKSNVFRFMSRFDVFDSSEDEELRDLWRIFDTDERDFDRLPTNTSMRRAYVEHLKGGGKLGRGHGVFFM